MAKKKSILKKKAALEKEAAPENRATAKKKAAPKKAAAKKKAAPKRRRKAAAKRKAASKKKAAPKQSAASVPDWPQIKAYFTPTDVQHMLGRGLDLEDCNAVRASGQMIFNKLAGGDMPPGNPWPKEWIDNFYLWWKMGPPCPGAALAATTESAAFAIEPAAATSVPDWEQIKTYFTPTDVQHMLGMGLNLEDCNDVRANAQAIFNQVAAGTMPPGNPWSSEWINNFYQWWKMGPPCPTAAPAEHAEFATAAVEPATSSSVPDWEQIKAYFTPTDVQHMLGLGLNLEDCNDVRNNAQAIYNQVASGAMPPGNPWPQEWVSGFYHWWKEGPPCPGAAPAPMPASLSAMAATSVPTWSQIKTYFTPTDVQHMLGLGINLADCNDVRNNAQAIYNQVASGNMPPGNPWQSEWINNFYQWWKLGTCP